MECLDVLEKGDCSKWTGCSWNGDSGMCVTKPNCKTEMHSFLPMDRLCKRPKGRRFVWFFSCIC